MHLSHFESSDNLESMLNGGGEARAELSILVKGRATVIERWEQIARGALGVLQGYGKGGMGTVVSLHDQAKTEGN